MKPRVFPNRLLESVRRVDTIFVVTICLLLSGLLLAVWFGQVPVFGDALGYSYTSAHWIACNDLQPVPAGEGRGEQAMGHPAFFFWLWAVLMKLLGNTLLTAKLLPAVGAGLALAGTWKFAENISRDRIAGPLAALGLLASPLFLAQAFRAMPDSAHLAAVAWSLYFFSRGDRFKAALLCVVATVFREQGIFLGASYILADLIKQRRFRMKSILLYSSPLLVIIVTGLLNLKMNGFFFFPTYMGEASPILEEGWLINRTRLFAGHFLGEDFHWIPVAACLAIIFSEKNHRWGFMAILVLLLPSILYPPTRIAYLGVITVLYGWSLLKRRHLPSTVTVAGLSFVGMLVAFHVLIVVKSPDPALNLFRYVFGAYVPFMALLAARISDAGRRTAVPVWLLFCTLTLSSAGTVHYVWQPDTSPMGLVEVVKFREAISLSNNPIAPGPYILSDPAMGYVKESVTFNPDIPGNIVVSTCEANPEAVNRLIPQGYRLTGDSAFVWRDQGLTVLSLGIEPVPK
ncbi:MAG: glycosyltransferase family 39 protein [Candidatus Aegiribacteria sp.]|nr:glycosyltransferase family 39 protein [Candidatus Aegiribacteria sp.]